MLGLVLVDEMLWQGFMKDKEIIEAQQKMLEGKDKFDSRGMQVDEAFIHFRRVYDALLIQERENYHFHERQIGNSIIQSG